MSKLNKVFMYKKNVSMESPYPDDKRMVYHFWIDLNEIPPGLPTDVNPRDVNDKTKVYKKIANAITSSDESFFVNNRGILIAAKDVKIDTLNRKLTLDLGDDDDDFSKTLYGVLDGGHTYNAILKYRKKNDQNIKQYVHLEVMTAVRNIDELASARNTSAQVSDKAIAELAEKFEFVKAVLNDQPYANEISYRENETDKRLDSVDFVRLMFCYNIFKYPRDSNVQPISAYSGKAQVLKDYLTEYDNPNNPYKLIAPLLPKIVELHDRIEKDMPTAYLELNSSGRFGSVKGVDRKENSTTKFFAEATIHQISQGLIFPIVASFRALVKDSNNGLTWEVDPLIIWDTIKSKLVNNTIEMSRQLGNNPQSAGKSSTLWSQNYDAVNTAKLQVLFDQLNKD
ncbi:AIPR family protein [Paenibacillus sp. FSL K6-1230]|uniref:AIPR family protein n=1 Tax=Paenibacillus sp. FSL K6-1230 TaxID=2921603 RepID=UPI0030F97E12